jgi:hypothetical protein
VAIRRAAAAQVELERKDGTQHPHILAFCAETKRG